MKTVYCLGPEGSYSTIIAKQMYPKSSIRACNGFFEIIKNISIKDNAIGIFPIENSTTSDVHENVDYLFSSNDLHIIDEGYLSIRLHLIGLNKSKIKDITTVYSHLKALAQVANYCKNHGFQVKEAESTAAAKNIIVSQNDSKIACIGSSELITDDNLRIIEENIGDFQNNTTRFLAVIKSKINPPIIKEEPIYKCSYIFRLKHEPGILAHLLTKLSELNVNLTKIESRPMPGTQWEYNFLVDLEVKVEYLDKIKEIFMENTTMNRNIGIYTKGKTYKS